MNNKIFNFKEASCKNCYKCLRSCPVKAIQFKNGQARVISELCILCGNCINICPQNAKEVSKEIDEFDCRLKDKKIVVSLAPSFSKYFSYTKIKNALLNIGVHDVEETSIGAYFASKKIACDLKEKTSENVIGNACYSIVRLITTHYPEYIKYLPNTPSPMTFHARLIKKKYEDEVLVVFIGPCLSKKEEAMKYEGVDIVLTFEEISEYFQSKNIDLINDVEVVCNLESKLTERYYPEPGGMLKSIDFKDFGYEAFTFDGIENVQRVLNDLDKRGNMFLELLACQGGCVNGPCISPQELSLLDYRKYCNSGFDKGVINEYEALLDDSICDMTYKNEQVIEIMPGNEEIIKVLAKVGKYNKDQELNCGACGYRTCREKAIAVINKKAEMEMCLPYMQERAKSISDKILKASPNAIIALDHKLNIVEINQSATVLFGLKDRNIENVNISKYIDTAEIFECIDSNKNIINKERKLEMFGKWVERSIVLIPSQEIVLVFYERYN